MKEHILKKKVIYIYKYLKLGMKEPVYSHSTIYNKGFVYVFGGVKSVFSNGGYDEVE